MNYQKIYDDLVEAARNRAKPDCYTERHHILPKCLGGNDSKDNLVALTAREHFIAHRLLAKIYPKSRGLQYAIGCFSTRDNLTSKQYELAKISVSNANRGRVYSEESKAKMSAARKEYFANNPEARVKIGTEKTGNTYTLGYKHTKETKAKISVANTGRASMLGHKHTEETKTKMSISLKGRPAPNLGIPHSDETKSKISAACKGKTLGRPKSETTKQKMKEAWIKRREAKCKMS